MKTKTRLSIILNGLFISSLACFILLACSKDEQNDEPITNLPIIQILTPTTTEINVEPMEQVVLNLTATASPENGEKLVQFKITKQFEFEALEIVMDSIIDTSSFSLINYSIWAPLQNGTEVWTFEAKDESGDVTKETITLTIEGEIPDVKPLIELKSGNHPETGWAYVDGDVAMPVGEPFVFGFVTATNSLSNLKNVKVTRNYENVSLNKVLDSSINVNTFTMDIQTIAYPNTSGNEVFEIMVIDYDNNSNSVTFSITTTQQDPGINHFQNIELGSYTSTISSPFATTTGQSYTLVELEDPTQQSKIDWVYFHGATFGHTLMSPSNDFLYSVYPTIEDWDNKNSTLFVKTNLSVSQYNFIENKNQLILTWTNNSINPTMDFYSELMSSPGGFSQNDIIAFETQASKYGFLKIVDVISAAQNGNSIIKFDVKVVK